MQRLFFDLLSFLVEKIASVGSTIAASDSSYFLHHLSIFANGMLQMNAVLNAYVSRFGDRMRG